jgi:DEAD/DEAH box helicase domain-containing protein
MGYLVLDTELPSPVTGEPGATWDDARAGKLGISVVCLFDGDSGLFSFYDNNNLEELGYLIESADTIVTFNGIGFDIPVISGVIGRTLLPKGHYDILQEIWDALGSRAKGYRLGMVAERTIGKKKLRSDAPALYEEGRFAELFSYCLHDVWLTDQLFQHIIEFGYIIDPSGERLRLRS